MIRFEPPARKIPGGRFLETGDCGTNASKDCASERLSFAD